MIEIKDAAALGDNLQWFDRALRVYAPARELRAVLGIAIALMAIWLMQSVRPFAGLRSGEQRLRLMQRCALAWLAVGMLLGAVAPYLPRNGHFAAIWIIVDGACFMLLLATILLERNKSD